MRTIILLSIITHLHVDAMKRLRPSADTRIVKKLCPSAKNQCLPTDMFYQILKACPYNKDKLKTVANTIKALALTHKALYSCYNNEIAFNELLNAIHTIRHWSHESIGRFICPPKAHNQLIFQGKLKSLLLSGYPLSTIKEKLKNLIHNKVRFDFTYNYNNQPHTPLMFNISSEIFNFMLDNGSNINEATSNGTTVLMMASQYPMAKKNINRLIENQDIDINQTNNRGETALLRCIRTRKQRSVSDAFFLTIKFLLKKGADPLQADNKGNTPLSMAKRLNNNPQNNKYGVIKLIERAVIKKNKLRAKD